MLASDDQSRVSTMTPGRFLLLLCALVLCSCASSNSSEGPGVYSKAVGAADEAFAIQSLRTIATAEAQMKSSRGVYGDFNSLIGAGFLDQRFAGNAPTLKGYRFTIGATGSEFAVNADPQTSNGQPATGNRHFYLDSTDNSVHFNLNEPASKKDAVL